MLKPLPKGKTIVGIGDLHLPFSSPRALHWLYNKILKPLQPHIIVQLGDLYDLFSYSKFPKRMVMTPAQEVELARSEAAEFWRQVRRLVPKAKLYQLLGNHDARLAKRVMDMANWVEPFVDYESAWTFPYVETLRGPDEALRLYNWYFIHGFRENGKHMESVDFQNVCLGHTHRGGSWSYRFNRRDAPQVVTELNAGYLADPFHPSLIYRPLRKFFKWTPGVGVIDYQGGRFIPFHG